MTTKPKKSQVLKEALKNAIREVIREELRGIIREELGPVKPLIENNKKVNFQDFLPKPNQPRKIESTYSNTGGNIFNKLMQDTQRNMTSEDYKTIAMGNTNVVDIPYPTEYSQGLADSIGEMQEWEPSNMKGFNFPI